MSNTHANLSLTRIFYASLGGTLLVLALASAVLLS
jgi:hypothetical protein